MQHQLVVSLYRKHRTRELYEGLLNVSTYSVLLYSSTLSTLILTLCRWGRSKKEEEYCAVVSLVFVSALFSLIRTDRRMVTDVQSCAHLDMCVVYVC